MTIREWRVWNKDPHGNLERLRDSHLHDRRKQKMQVPVVTRSPYGQLVVLIFSMRSLLEAFFCQLDSAPKRLAAWERSRWLSVDKSREPQGFMLVTLSEIIIYIVSSHDK